MNPFRLFPVEASANAHAVDTAFFVIMGISVAICLLLFVLIVTFAFRYRRGSRVKRGPLPDILRREIELGWTAGALFLAIFIFWWFAGGFQNPDADDARNVIIHVVAKQWMWKVEHANGAREIDALHLPVGSPVELEMVSQDVIHSFYVPAFRLKQDVLPARYTKLFFTPDRIGSYHLFCAEYCGTQHSRMTGEVVVMSAPDYAAWLANQPHGDTLVEEGGVLYAKLGCAACHAAHAQVHAPKLDHLYENTVTLAGGEKIVADDAYIARSILAPREQITAGYDPIMPSYSGVIKAADVQALVAYLKALSRGEADE